MNKVQFITFLHNQGYKNIREVPGHGVCGIQRFAFTYGLICDCKSMGYSDRYCYSSQEEAEQALKEWDGIGHPSGRWIKHKGRNNQGQFIDELNPNLTEVF